MARQLTLEDYGLVIGRMLDEQGELLELTATGREVYRPQLEEYRASYLALPHVQKGRLLAEELEAADDRHDSYGRAVWHLTEASKALAAVDPGSAALAETIQSTFVPALGELQDPYVEQAAAAEARQPKLAEHEAALKGWPVLGAASLYDWVAAQLAAGEEQERLLAERGEKASALPPEGRREAARLRLKIRGVLSEMRRVLQREVARKPDLPRDLVSRLFGFHDEIVRSRGAQQRRAASGPAAPEAGAAPPA